MGDVVEQHQTRPGRVLEVDDVEAGGRLIQPVAVAAGVEPEQAREQQAAQRRLVRDNQYVLPGVRDDDLPHHRQRARQHAQA
jgi:hypothetical protein